MANTGERHLQHEVIVTGLSNTFFNGLVAWLLLRNGPALGWHGEPSFAVDIIATALLLPFIVALIVIPLQRGKLRKGKLQTISLGSSSIAQSLADRLPHSTLKSALLFGLLGILAIAPMTLLGFHVLGIEQVTPLYYALFKGLWAGLMAATLVLPMVLFALRDATQDTRHDSSRENLQGAEQNPTQRSIQDEFYASINTRLREN